MNETPEFFFALTEDLKDNKEFLPTRAEELSTGWDVRAATLDKKPLIVRPFEYVKVSLGFRSYCPGNWWLSLKPRSSSFGKKSLHFLYGTVDSSYEGIMLACFQYIPEFSLETDIEHRTGYYDEHWTEGTTYIKAPDLTIEFGEAIAQIIPVYRQEMTISQKSNAELDKMFKQRGAKRGIGGFGSTDGKKNELVNRLDGNIKKDIN